jgi:hypothetical protein
MWGFFENRLDGESHPIYFSGKGVFWCCGEDSPNNVKRAAGGLAGLIEQQGCYTEYRNIDHMETFYAQRQKGQVQP